MKRTIEIPDEMLRRAKTLAAANGITVKQLVAEALEGKLSECAKRIKAKEPAWIKLYGAFAKTKAMRAETRRIQKLIDAEFEGIDVETRK